jgi:ABC-type glycerol-3-phosphate transport system substrate-binding protein
MKMSTKKVAVATIASLALTTIAYAGSAIAATSSTTLNFYHDKKGWDSRFLAVSTALNDGAKIKLKPSTYADTTIYQNTLNQAAKTGKGPDLLTWWSGYRMVDGAKNGIFADITDVWTDAIKAGDVSADLQKQFQVGNKTYGIPNGVSFWPMFYNKKVFAANNLTVPKTWAEFINICDTLKAKGITPLTASVDGAWPAFIWFEQLLISQDPKLYLDLTSNKIKYTDPKVKAVLQIWKDMIDKGYFTAGDTSFFGEAAAALMAKGTMIPVGTWNNSAFSVTGGLVGGKDYDAFVIPNINPALKTQSIIVEAGAESWIITGAQKHHTCGHQQSIICMYVLMESGFITNKVAVCECPPDHSFSVHAPATLEHGHLVVKIVDQLSPVLQTTQIMMYVSQYGIAERWI